MKKRSWIAALLLLCVLFVFPAYADTITDLLESFGMTPQEAEVLAGMVAQSDGAMSEEDLRSMLAQFPQGNEGNTLQGTVTDGVFTSTNGYRFTIPEGWTLQEHQIGPAVVIAGPVDDKGLMPTITVMTVTSPADSILDKTQEEIDATLSKSLQNYTPVALDSFEFLELPAREMACTYGANAESMLMQYQLQFISGSNVFMITLTTLAEEATHDQALDTYDDFLSDFTLVTANSNG